MIYLSGAEEKEAAQYLNEAAKIALKSTCLRAKCGSVIVKDIAKDAEISSLAPLLFRGSHRKTRKNL